MAAAGGTLLAAGIRRGSVGGGLLALAGGWLLYRGLRGGSVAQRPGPDVGTETRPHPEARYEPPASPDRADAKRTVTVGVPPEEAYDRWRDPETLRRVFGAFAEVTAPHEDRLHWAIEGPLGGTVTWDTRVVAERPGELIEWESSENAPVPSEGAVRFRPAPGGQGTEVTLQMDFDPPGGRLGRAVTERLGFVPDTFVAAALRRFKSLVETGELPSLEKNASGRGRGDLV